MIKFKECCCGCGLRTGTLIILWTTLIIDALRSVLYIGKLLYDPNYSYFRGDMPLLTIFCDMIFLIACTSGIAVSVFGLYGILKNSPEFLNLCYYYYWVYVGYWLFLAFMVIVYPDIHHDITIFSPFYFFAHTGAAAEYTLVFVIGYLFLTAFTWYITMIIGSCKDYLMNNQGPGGGLERDIPDPTALGYSASFE